MIYKNTRTTQDFTLVALSFNLGLKFEQWYLKESSTWLSYLSASRKSTAAVQLCRHLIDMHV